MSDIADIKTDVDAHLCHYGIGDPLIKAQRDLETLWAMLTKK
jgi:hypothetical protein